MKTMHVVSSPIILLCWSAIGAAPDAGMAPSAINPPPNAAPETSKPPPLPSRLELTRKVGWGYGCGGHCAFNHSGESDVAVEFSSGGAVQIIDAGSGRATMNQPEGSTYTTRKWKNVWKGTVKDTSTSRTMDLKPDSSQCDETVSSGKMRETRRCHTTVKNLAVVCTNEKIPTHLAVPAPGGNKSGTPADALVCRTEKDAAGYSGTELPWVFGIGTKITTMYVGEPHAETYYVLEK